MAKKKSSEAQLRQMIRKIVREELQRMQNLEDSEWRIRTFRNRGEDAGKAGRPGRTSMIPIRSITATCLRSIPLGSTSGRPQPDPSRKREQSPRVPEWPGPYTPDLETTL